MTPDLPTDDAYADVVFDRFLIAIEPLLSMADLERAGELLINDDPSFFAFIEEKIPDVRAKLTALLG